MARQRGRRKSKRSGSRKRSSGFDNMSNLLTR